MSQKTTWLCLIVEHSQPDREQPDQTEDNLDRISKRMSTKEKELTRRKGKDSQQDQTSHQWPS